MDADIAVAIVGTANAVSPQLWRALSTLGRAGPQQLAFHWTGSPTRDHAQACADALASGARGLLILSAGSQPTPSFSVDALLAICGETVSSESDRQQRPHARVAYLGYDLMSSLGTTWEFLRCRGSSPAFKAAHARVIRCGAPLLPTALILNAPAMAALSAAGASHGTVGLDAACVLAFGDAGSKGSHVAACVPCLFVSARPDMSLMLASAAAWADYALTLLKAHERQLAVSAVVVSLFALVALWTAYVKCREWAASFALPPRFCPRL